MPESASGDERLKELLDELLDMPQPERERRLAEATSGLPALEQELRGLLESFEGAGEGFLERRAAPPTAPLALPETIGPYEIEGLLGRGGMAHVYRARQRAPIEREVAIKVLQAHRTEPEILMRFESERQVLARLEHPGIARVIDAGAEPYGPAYFVMELVEGRPITEVAEARGLPLSERLRLAIQVCEAVHHAHGRGILHRDLKPSNLLVAEVEGRFVPKVIDFGVAKALGLDERLAEDTLTRAGELVGTLEYMSPEQAGFQGGEVTIRSDVFSIGVVLFELVAGVLPHRLEGQDVGSLSEFLRVLEHQDPGPPSRRRLDSVPLDLPRPAVRDLDCVVRRALERDPARRFSTLSELAGDLKRVLTGAPVEARPPTRSYVLSRFVLRHRMLTLSLAAVALALVAGTVGTGYGLLRSLDKERQLAETTERLREALRESEEVGAYLARLAARSQAEDLGPDVPYIEVLERAGEELLDSSSGLGDAVRGRLASAVGSALYEAERTKAALPLLERSLELLGRVDRTPERDSVRLGVLQVLGGLNLDGGRLDLAEVHFEQALALLPDAGLPPEKTLELAIRLEDSAAAVLAERGDHVGAIPLQRSALARALESGSSASQIAVLRSSLSITLLTAGEIEAAEREARAAYEHRLEAYPPRDFRTANTARVLARSLVLQGRADEGLALLDGLLERADYEADDPRGLLLVLDRAYMAGTNSDDPEAAAAAYDEIADGVIEAYSDRARFQAAVRLRGLEWRARIDGEAARAEGAALLDALRAELGPGDHPDWTRANLTLGRALDLGGRPELARPYLQEALDAMQRASSGESRAMAELREQLAATPR